ncbi:MAG: alpha/beta hydrolase [Bacteroidetes bacterium]|nr:alpha/beta hydrolase [Bacteroidota bacterium]
MLRVALFFSVAMVMLCGCKQEQQSATPPIPNEETTLNDVSYGNHPLEKMDVYLPKNRTANTRIIVFIHGGGWFSGDKADGRDGATYFQKQGYAFISINYRLTRTPENNIHPAQIEDIGKALDFIGQKNKEWTLTNNRIVLFGGSAGAHMAMLYAYKYDGAKKIKAVISIAGPTDLTDSAIRTNNLGDLTIEEVIESFIGAKITTDIKAWQEASPINYISSASPPTFFIHGTNDHTVPYQQSVSAYNKLKNAGGIAQLETLNGVDHDLIGINWLDVLPKIENFVIINTP